MLKVTFAGGLKPSFKFKVSPNTRLEELLKSILLTSSCNVQILAGFPPTLVRGEASDTLATLGIKAGDSITVREGSPPTLSDHENGGSDSTATHVPSPDVAPIASHGASGSVGVADDPAATEMIRLLMSLGFSREVCEQASSIVGPSMESFDLAAETCAAIFLSLGEGKASIPTTTQSSSATPPASAAPAALPPMKRLAIDADNSCLFRAVGFCAEFDGNGDPNRVATDKYRQMIAAHVLAGGDDGFCCEAVLNMTQAAYAAWILKPEKWGGELEVSILARRLSVHIKVFDIRTQICHTYSPDGDGFATQRTIFLIYDGIHYDCLVRGPPVGSVVAQTIFALDDADASNQCNEISSDALSKRKFTLIDDKTGKFELVCLVCQQALRHADDARAHAAETGHQNFGQM